MVDFFSRHRKRLDPLQRDPYYYTVSGNVSATEGSGPVFDQGQETWDNPTVWRYSLNKGSNLYKALHSRTRAELLDIGGPFLSTRWSYKDSGTGPFTVNITRAGRPSSWTGHVYGYANGYTRFSGNTSNALRSLDPSDGGVLNAAGATAISRVAPTNPHASAFAAFGELFRDGLPAAMGVNTVLRKDLAGEYLNYEFGIKPFLADARSLHNSYKNAAKLLSQYYRDSGKVVRRRYEFPPTIETTTSTSSSIAAPAISSSFYRTMSGTLRKTETLERRVWFSGAFTYFAKEPNSFLSIVDQARKYEYLFGVLPTPGALWDLTPWSWLGDWVTNMGDVLNNLSMFSADGLVMQYGYVMEHSIRTTEYSHSGTVFQDGTAPTPIQTFTVETKYRRQATPFGFGLDSESFTTRQWAILAALGITRSGKYAR